MTDEARLRREILLARLLHLYLYRGRIETHGGDFQYVRNVMKSTTWLRSFSSAAQQKNCDVRTRVSAKRDFIRQESDEVVVTAA